MEKTRDELRDEVLVLLNAGRELAPVHDEALADAFLRRLEARRRSRARRTNQLVRLYLVTVIALVVIPIGMIVNTYVTNDGVLPRPDAGALPALYWVALIVVMLLAVCSMMLERTGRQIRVTLARAGGPSRRAGRS